MSLNLLSAAATWWASDVPLLPAREAMQWGLQASWSVVLAWLGAVLARRWTNLRAVPWGVAVALAASAWLPGQASSSYWLGLAFQAPSISAVLWCALLICAQWGRGGVAPGNGPHVAASATPAVVAAGKAAYGPMPDAVLAILGVVLGWALLLDTLALLPVSLYAWGFGPGAVLVLGLLGVLPWLFFGGSGRGGRGTLVWGGAVLAFGVWRLPSGNVWDAVLDPWLWLGLHVLVGRWLLVCYKNRSLLRLLDAR